MSSASKTSNLNLNVWAGSDKPTRSDFNSDNNIIDSLCGGHISNNNIHVTAEQKSTWSNPFVIGTYFGTGVNSRTFSLGFNPRLVIVFANDYPLVTSDYTYTSSKCYAAIGTANGASMGVVLETGGFSIAQSSVMAVDDCTAMLNQSGAVYTYIAFK